MTTTLPEHQALPLELIDTITDEVYNSSDNSREDLYNLSLTSCQVGKQAMALIFRVVQLKGASESELDKSISKLHVLFESNRNLAISAKVLIIGNPKEPANTSSPNFLPVLRMMRNLNVIKLTGNGEYSEPPPPPIPRRRGRSRQVQPGPVPICTAFTIPANLMDIRLYNMSMKYQEFENILRSSPALTALLISNLDIREFPTYSCPDGHGMAGFQITLSRLSAQDSSQPPDRTANHEIVVKLRLYNNGPSWPLSITSSLTWTPQKSRNLSCLRLTQQGSIRQYSHFSQLSTSSISVMITLGAIVIPGQNNHHMLDTVHLPICEALEFRSIFFDWKAFSLINVWFAGLLETILMFPTQLPVKKLLLVFDFLFFCGPDIRNMPVPDIDWFHLDSALCMHNFDLEEIGVHIILPVEDPNNEADLGNTSESDDAEEDETEENDGSESGVEESRYDRGLPSEEIDRESDEESDPDDTTYITDQSEYTDAEEGEDVMELGKKDGHDEDGTGQDNKKEVYINPQHMLVQHWLFEFALPRANTRYHFQERMLTDSSTSADRVKTWVRLSERTSEIEPIFDNDEDLQK
ncbi:hypothetical protein IW262DRAFT_1301091 [Armillaria fumosa]|nr:hypothetical protein IW262DRAFT_1301091 [Armillaria fumosa]